MLFCDSLLCGMVLVAVYDGIKIFRLFFPPGRFMEAVQDLLYWIFDALYIFRMLYRENNGMIRGYVMAGIFLGMLACHLTLEPPVMWLGGVLAGKFRKICEKVKNTLKKMVKPFTMKLYYKSEAGRRDGKEKE